jgi:hypothetical protein
MSQSSPPSGGAAGGARASSSLRASLAAEADAALVGRSVCRLRGRRGVTHGVVTSYGVIPGVGPMWCVEYGGEGGAREEVDRAELATMLVPLPPPPRKRKRATASSAVSPPAGAGARASPSSPASSPAHRYRGVRWRSNKERWEVWCWHQVNGKRTYVGQFKREQAVAAARAYDDAVRAQGGTAVNFPRKGTAETQAKAYTQRGRTGGTSAAPPAAAAPPAPRARSGAASASPASAATPAAGGGGAAFTPRPAGAPHFRGVGWRSGQGVWEVRCKNRATGDMQNLGSFPPNKQLAAARAYDDAVRKQGGTRVNFPRKGTAETQAKQGMRRSVPVSPPAASSLPPPHGGHGEHKKARGSGAGAAGAAAPSPPPKRKPPRPAPQPAPQPAPEPPRRYLGVCADGRKFRARARAATGSTKASAATTLQQRRRARTMLSRGAAAGRSTSRMRMTMRMRMRVRMQMMTVMVRRMRRRM